MLIVNISTYEFVKDFNFMVSASILAFMLLFRSLLFLIHFLYPKGHLGKTNLKYFTYIYPIFWTQIGLSGLIANNNNKTN